MSHNVSYADWRSLTLTDYKIIVWWGLLEQKKDGWIHDIDGETYPLRRAEYYTPDRMSLWEKFK